MNQEKRVKTMGRRGRGKGGVSPFRGPKYECQPTVSNGKVLRESCGRMQIHQGACICGNKTEQVYT